MSKKYTIYSSEIIVDDQAYTIIKPLGKGGFGTVIEIMSSDKKEYFAMKVPLIFDEIYSNSKANKEEEIELSRKYLENEIDTIINFQSETYLYIMKRGTAKTYFQGKHVEFPVYLMELAECTVKELMDFGEKKGHKIAFEENVKIIKETLNAMSHLHSMNVIHRDLSHDNIFVVDRGGRITYVLGDFGASKRLLTLKDSSKSSKIVGHSAYLDPARFEEKYRYDPRADVYSLGIIITEILMGKYWVKEFGEENISHLMAVDFEKDFLLPKSEKYLSKDLIKVLQKAVKRNPEERYDSVDAFREAMFRSLDIDSSRPSSSPDLESNPLSEVGPREKTLTLDFLFSIPLPLKGTAKTFTQDIVKFEGQREITLTDYRGAKIDFDRFQPKEVELKNTSLYSATILGNSILINFKNSRLKQLMKPVAKHQATMKGTMDFTGTIETRGVYEQ
jgi:serine/threonine protein kinase